MKRNRETHQLEPMCFPCKSCCRQWLCVQGVLGSSFGSKDIVHTTCLKECQPESSKYSFQIHLTTRKGMESHAILSATVNWPLILGPISLLESETEWQQSGCSVTFLLLTPCLVTRILYFMSQFYLCLEPAVDSHFLFPVIRTHSGYH